MHADDLLRGAPALARLEVRTGRVTQSAQAVRLELAHADGTQYANAQLDDYRMAGGRRFRWRPPLRLMVEARFSHPVGSLHGTAGFGFWNDPFGMSGRARLRLPSTLWYFFGGEPTDLPLAEGVPGHGWKAAMLDANRWEALATLPSAPLVMALLRVPRLGGWLWRRVQQRLRIAEAALELDMSVWHRYEIAWHRGRSVFTVDGDSILAAPFSPQGPLGLVVWMDNQTMVATPRGQFRHGVVANGDQWLEIRTLQITQD